MPPFENFIITLEIFRQLNNILLKPSFGAVAENTHPSFLRLSEMINGLRIRAIMQSRYSKPYFIHAIYI